MDRLLEFLLRRFVRCGTLRITTARGFVISIGDGTGNPVAVRFMSRAAELAVLLDPELKLGETYMDDTLRMEEGTIADFLDLIVRNIASYQPTLFDRACTQMRAMLRHVFSFNNRARSVKNAKSGLHPVSLTPA